MVTIRLAGRLGNYLHEVATVYAYAKRHNMEYRIPISTDVYGFENMFPKVHIENIDTTGFTEYYEPKNQTYAPITYADNIVLNGYFQSERYYRDYRNDIIDLFEVPQGTKKGVVSIHVRRGDYVKYANVFPPVTKEYIREAIQCFVGAGDFIFEVYSDDIEWCKANFPTINQLKGATSLQYRFIEPDLVNPLGDFYSMSQCEHNIIANSSYSWWAAWLNSNPNKVVVCPSMFNWFGRASNLNTKDYLPESWVQIKY